MEAKNPTALYCGKFPAGISERCISGRTVWMLRLQKHGARIRITIPVNLYKLLCKLIFAYLP